MSEVTSSLQRISRYTEEVEKLHRQVLTAVNANEASSTAHFICYSFINIMSYN